MSHLIEEYAKNLGVIVSRPILSDHFFPLVSKKYITLQTTKKFDSRDYSYWEIAISLMKKNLDGYDVIHVGSEDDPEVRNVDLDLRGKTSFKQLFFIIKNSSLHVGIDSLGVHLASCYDVPCVGLYSNMLSSMSGPVWHKKSKFKCIDSDKKGDKPSYLATEYPKTINNIHPEVVAKSCLDILCLKNDLDNYKTINIGKHYNNKITEVIPDFLPEKEEFRDKLVNLRFDFNCPEEFQAEWLDRPCNLMINKPVDIYLIHAKRSNIKGMTIFLGEHDFDETYFKNLTSFGINFTLISKYPEKLPELRLKFFDYTIEEYKINSKKDLDINDDLCDNTFYHSNKTLISKNKKYNSKAAWKKDIEKTDEPQKVIDSDDFWEELQHMNIYNYAKN